MVSIINNTISSSSDYLITVNWIELAIANSPYDQKVFVKGMEQLAKTALPITVNQEDLSLKNNFLVWVYNLVGLIETGKIDSSVVVEIGAVLTKHAVVDSKAIEEIIVLIREKVRAVPYE